MKLGEIKSKIIQDLLEKCVELLDEEYNNYLKISCDMTNISE